MLGRESCSVGIMAHRDFTMSTPKQAIWTPGTVVLEGYARMQGYYVDCTLSTRPRVKSNLQKRGVYCEKQDREGETRCPGERTVGNSN
jgi:hypothetical protein